MNGRSSIRAKNKGKLIMNKVAASKFNKPMVLIMVLAVLVLLLMAVALVFNNTGDESELPVQTDHDLHDHDSHSVESSTVESNHADDSSNDDSSNDDSSNNDSSNNDAMPRHQDMLTEEMKQAIRDKLFFHGPKEVIKHPDGRIELPSNGRFTQMPVAVKMPDGTIQIKEYSSLPE